MINGNIPNIPHPMNQLKMNQFNSKPVLYPSNPQNTINLPINQSKNPNHQQIQSYPQQRSPQQNQMNYSLSTIQQSQNYSQQRSFNSFSGNNPSPGNKRDDVLEHYNMVRKVAYHSQNGINIYFLNKNNLN